MATTPSATARPRAAARRTSRRPTPTPPTATNCYRWQLLSVANGGTTRSLGYSPTGNLASDNRGSGTALSFTYDLSDRLVQVANQNQPLATYAYNFMGQRVAKTTPSTVTNFLYDRAGHLLAESNGATGAAQTEYLWLDDTPLALVTNGNLYFIHSDHLNTPQKATDASQNVAWDAVPRPFGQTEQQTFPSLTNLRFPGQYFDVEDGLHQNWFRDYDSSIGRYVESDPIGLKGGVNTYAYVRANPINYKDRTGKQPWKDLEDLHNSLNMCLEIPPPPPPPPLPQPKFCDKAHPYGYPDPNQPYVSNPTPEAERWHTSKVTDTPDFSAPAEPVNLR